MPDTKTEKYSLFALEHKQLGDVHVELGARVDHQKYKLNLNRKLFRHRRLCCLPNWEFAPNYKLSIVGSHQQRLPLAQELYANGLHFATNTYEVGNPDLEKKARIT